MTNATSGPPANAPRRCPVCDAYEPQRLFRQEFATVDAASIVDGYDVVVCGRCGGAYADDIPEQSAFDAYYRTMSKYEYHQRDGAESEFDERRLTLIAGVIAPYLPDSDARILDVGCASGRLLALLRDRGYADVHGLDPSPSCADAARRLYGIPVRTATLADLKATGDTFDVVILVGVLEHLRDVSASLDEVRAVLRPEGLLYVEVPDALAFADWPNAPYQDFSTEHINFFSPDSLGNLMARHGFSPVHVEQNSREQSYRTVMSNISAMYRHDGLEGSDSIGFDARSRPALERYIADCGTVEAELHRRIDTLVQGGRPIIVWGVGTHTGRLMATSRLADAHIAAFVESNVRYHGREMHGRPIIAPAALSGRGEPILISSRVFQHEIAHQIREDLGLPNEIVVLYEID